VTTLVTMKHAQIAAVISLSLCFAADVRASRISSVTASTPDMGSSFGTNLVNTVNGVGLSTLSLTATHDGTVPLNSWVSANGVLTGHVIFDFGTAFLVDSFSFWNQNAGGPGALGITGIDAVQVSTSLDGTTYVPLAGGPTQFSQIMTAPAGPQIFNFVPVSARFFEFTIGSNWGDPVETGFGEVGFDAIPEPATSVLIASGCVALCALISRKRAAGL
jgi:hypothetical protein